MTHYWHPKSSPTAVAKLSHRYRSGEHHIPQKECSGTTTADCLAPKSASSSLIERRQNCHALKPSVDCDGHVTPDAHGTSHVARRTSNTSQPDCSGSTLSNLLSVRPAVQYALAGPLPGCCISEKQADGRALTPIENLAGLSSQDGQ